MRKYLFLTLVLSLFLSSCEDVIDVELPSTETRLVVDGLIRVDMSQEFAPIAIKVLESSNFFNDNVPAQLDDNATIFYGQPDPQFPEIINNLASSSLTELEPGSGIYVPDPSFDEDQRIRTASIQPNTVFILFLQHKGRRYASRTPFSPTVPIDSFIQGDDTLFDEEDIELEVTFTDVPDQENYYIFDFGESDFLTIDDQFVDGQDFQFSYYTNRTLEVGEEVTVSILGADLEFYNYMGLLVEQAERQGGIFETPSATVRGNIFDVTGLDNNLVIDNVNRPEAFPLGYFAVVEEFKSELTIQ